MLEQLTARVEKEIAALPIRQAEAAARALSERYRRAERAPNGQKLLQGQAEAAAYAACRMPATARAVGAALDMALACAPNARQASTLTDVGAGPGSALWAAASRLALTSATLVEREEEMASLGLRLAKEAGLPPMRWVLGDARQLDLPEADLIIAAYSLGEMEQTDAEALVGRLWGAAKRLLLLVEPGTPSGFARVRRYRRLLEERGAHIAAPCPPGPDCPLTEDWCHFVCRVPRTSLHRRLKEGRAGYEDEKFSFIAAARGEVCPPAARVRRHPRVHGGWIELPLCGGCSVWEEKVTRSQQSYKRARKAQVGAPWEEGET